MRKPLEGIRVFDLTIAAAGPWASMLLGALGAEVIKIERYEGDMSIGTPPPVKGMGILYPTCNFNKKGIMLDLKDEKCMEVARSLVANCDVFVQNMRPGVVDRLGLGYEVIAQINPRIVYLSLDSYGDRGPMAGEASADPQFQAFSGWSSITGQPGGRGEMFRHYAHMDITASSYGVEGILMALYDRENTGKGQYIHVTTHGAAMALQTTRFAEYFASQKMPVPMGSACATTVPHQAFLCQESKYVAVGVVCEEQWVGLCNALGQQELLEDARFRRNADRVAHREELIPLLEKIFISKPVEWWVIHLNKYGVPCRPFVVMNWDLIRDHRQNVENQHIVNEETPWGPMYFGSPPWKFQDIRPEWTPPPEPGIHTEEIYESLGYEVTPELKQKLEEARTVNFYKIRVTA